MWRLLNDADSNVIPVSELNISPTWAGMAWGGGGPRGWWWNTLSAKPSTFLLPLQLSSVAGGSCWLRTGVAVKPDHEWNGSCITWPAQPHRDGWHRLQDTLGLDLSNLSVCVSIGGDMPNRWQKEDLFLLIRGKIILSPNIKLMHM